MHQLLHGDCYELISNLSDKSIDLVITDPPYKFQSSGGGFYSNANNDKRMYIDNLKNANCCEFEPIKFLELLKPKMKKFYGYFFCNKVLLADYIKFADDNKYNFDILVLAKNNPIPAFNRHHLSDLEYIVMIRAKGTYFSKHKDIDDFRKFYITSCKKGLHPAEKPIELLERFIRVSSEENNIVLDPFMGSGSTGVACLNTDRDFIGIELEDKYFKMAQERIENKVIV